MKRVQGLPFTEQNPSSVEDIRVVPVAGPWRSKSGGMVTVPFVLPHAEMLQFFSHDPAELACIPADISGLRIFTLDNVPRGGIGGREFHRLRTEVAITTKGRVRWNFEDVYGGEKEVVPELGCALLIPPFILHRMEGEAPESSVLVLANTLFVPEDRRTHDGYPDELFRRLQRRYRKNMSSAHQD